LKIDPEKEHTWLMRGIAGSIGLTVFLAGIIFADISGIHETLQTMSEDIGYIKGVISAWDAEYQIFKNIVP